MAQTIKIIDKNRNIKDISKYNIQISKLFDNISLIVRDNLFLAAVYAFFFIEQKLIKTF